MPKKHAIILSGGGAKGAFEIGVMKALFPGHARMPTGGEPIDPIVFCGTSVGAFNAAFLTSRPGEAPVKTLRDLEAIWRNVIASTTTRENGVMRFRANPFDVMNIDRLFNDPMLPVRRFFEDGAFFTKDAIERAELFYNSTERLTRRMIQVIDFSAFVATDKLKQLVTTHVKLDQVRANKTQAAIIAATNWEKGEVQLFGNLPPEGELAGLNELTDKIGHLAILASAAIPGVFPPVEIYHTKYVDGGLLLNTPLAPALSALRALAPDPADEYVIHVIYLDPDLRDVPLDRGNNTMETLNRFNALSFASQVNRDIKNAKHVNQTIEMVNATQAALVDDVHEVRQSFEAFLRPEYRPITIHRYHPSSLLGGIFGLLSFESDNINRLIDEGFQNAVTHDCKECGCIFPTMQHPMVNRRPSGEALSVAQSPVPR